MLTLTLQGLESSPLTEEQWQSWFKSWWQALIPTDFLVCDPPEAAELTLRLTDRAEMHALNRTWRGIDQPTDVLSFSALEDGWDHTEPELYLGDLVIGVEIAQAQAQLEGHDLETELAWLASHGLLHLLGWDHQHDQDLHAMIQRQLDLLKLINKGYMFDLEPDP